MALKLEIDWAGDVQPELEQGEGITLELVSAKGLGSGWPTYNVYAAGGTASEAGTRLWAWLKDVYGADEDEASELASDAEQV